MIEEVKRILRLKTSPANKNTLITLQLAENNILSVRQLNYYLNCEKTFQNYYQLLKEEIENGVVEVVILKDSYGTSRNHFKLNSENIIDED